MSETDQLTTHISRIQIQRLHNLGNYESIRYEVTVDIAPGDDAGKVLSNLETALNHIQAKFNTSTSTYNHFLKVLSEPTDQWGDAWKDTEIARAKEGIADYKATQAKREAAYLMLSNLNFTSEHCDAKDKWDDDEY